MMLSGMQLLHCTFHPRIRYSVATHAHDFHEWHWICGGRGSFMIGEQTLDLRPGDLFVIPPHTPHGVRMRRAGDWLLQYIVSVASDPADPLLEAWLERCRQHGPIVRINPRRHVFYENLRQDSESRDPWRIRSAEHRFQALICQLLAGQDVHSDQHPALVAAIAYMQDHLDGRITLDDCARQAGIDRSYLVRLFRRHLDTTPLRYFQHRQLDLAAGLLRDGGLSVRATAERLAFSDPAVFSRAFKRRFGCAPGVYARGS